jgi:DNA-binding IclR family transcriptional regulator
MSHKRSLKTHRTRIEESDSLDATVKSAERVLKILEYFDDIQTSATVMDIADTLKLPQSSTSALLRTLTTLGYLDNDRSKRTYIPTGRVALLGSWTNPDLVVGGRAVELVRDINEETGHTVLLVTRREQEIQLIHSIHDRAPDRPYVSRGARRSLVASATGYVLLAPVPDAEIRKMVFRYNANKRRTGPEIDTNELLAIVRKARIDGYAVRSSTQLIGGASLAVPLLGSAGRIFALAVGSSVSEEIFGNQQELLALIRSKVKYYFGSNSIGSATTRRPGKSTRVGAPASVPDARISH